MEEKNNKFKFEGHKVWLGEDGIIRAKIGPTLDLKIVKELFDICRKMAENLSTKPRISIDITTSPSIRTINFRKISGLMLKDLYKEILFEKMALWGGGTLRNTVATFIVGATGLKNIKCFNTEEEALKWLKKVGEK